MTLSDLLPIIIFLSIIAIWCIGVAIKTHRRKKKEKLPELGDYIIDEFDKELQRLKKIK